MTGRALGSSVRVVVLIHSVPRGGAVSVRHGDACGGGKLSEERRGERRFGVGVGDGAGERSSV